MAPMWDCTIVSACQLDVHSRDCKLSRVSSHEPPTLPTSGNRQGNHCQDARKSQTTCLKTFKTHSHDRARACRSLVRRSARMTWKSSGTCTASPVCVCTRSSGSVHRSMPCSRADLCFMTPASANALAEFCPPRAVCVQALQLAASTPSPG